MARAIHFAHEHSVIHRDLKPANVLMTGDGVPKIADFGLAKSLSSDSGFGVSGTLTRSGDVLGTPRYMAPEQASPHGLIGPATDIYGLGVIL